MDKENIRKRQLENRMEGLCLLLDRIKFKRKKEGIDHSVIQKEDQLTKLLVAV